MSNSEKAKVELEGGHKWIGSQVPQIKGYKNKRRIPICCRDQKSGKQSWFVIEGHVNLHVVHLKNNKEQSHVDPCFNVIPMHQHVNIGSNICKPQ